MKRLLLAVAAMTLWASPVIAADAGKVAVTSVEASSVIDGGVYMLKNSGSASVLWECNATTVSTANSSTLISGGTARVPEGCKTIAYKTSSGTAQLRWYVTEQAATGIGSSVSTGQSKGLVCTTCVDNTDLAIDIITVDEMADDDFGDWACSSGDCTLDIDVIAAAEMADADHGAVSWTSGVASVEAVDSQIIDAAAISNTLCFSVLQASVDPTEASATDDYLSLLDGSGSTTEANEDDYILANATLAFHSLNCFVATAPGVGNDPWVMTIRSGAVGSLGDSSHTCTIDEAATTCVGTGSSPSPTAGQAVTIGISSAGGDADPTANALVTCMVCTGN